MKKILPLYLPENLARIVNLVFYGFPLALFYLFVNPHTDSLLLIIIVIITFILKNKFQEPVENWLLTTKNKFVSHYVSEYAYYAFVSQMIKPKKSKHQLF